MGKSTGKQRESKEEILKEQKPAANCNGCFAYPAFCWVADVVAWRLKAA